MSDRAASHARPSDLRGPEERVHHDRSTRWPSRSCARATRSSSTPGLLLCAMRRGGEHDHAGQPGHRRPRRNAALHGQGGDRGVRATTSIPDDVFAVNDPYLGGTHFCDVRIVRPIFADGELIAFAQSNGHWADVGGSRAGLVRHQRQGPLRRGSSDPTPLIWDQGRYRWDVVRDDRLQHARPERRRGRPPRTGRGNRASPSASSCGSWRSTARTTVVTAFGEVQDYVERLTRQRVAELPDGTWETEDYIDLRPVRRRGLDPDPGQADDRGRPDPLRPLRLARCGRLVSELGLRSDAFSAVIAGTKTFFPDVPLNSGFYRAVSMDLGPEGTVVNAPWPVAVTGFCSGPYEKIMNAIFELWSQIMPERAIACSLQPRVPPGRRPRRAAPRTPRSSCGTTGWSAAGAAETARTAPTPPPRSSASGSRCSRSRARSA